MARSPTPLTIPDLTREELQALRDVKMGKPITSDMRARLTKMKLAEERLGFSLTNAGELRLIHVK
jgi:hypothetical protein